MIEQVIEAIDMWVQEIYTPDQNGLTEKYIAFLDAISIFLAEMEKNGYQVDMGKDLTTLQGLVEKKDYVALADFLLFFFSIQKMR